MSHTPAEQSVFCTHATHCPVLTSHAWFVWPAQSVFEAQPRHVLVVASQIGVLPEHSVFEVQTTHLPALPPLVAQ